MSTEKKVITAAGIMILFVLLLQVPHVIAYLACPDGTLGEILSQDGQLPPDMTYTQVFYDPDGWGPAEEKSLTYKDSGFDRAIDALLSIRMQKVYQQPSSLSLSDAQSSYRIFFGASIYLYLYEDGTISVHNTYSDLDILYRLDSETNLYALNSLWASDRSQTESSFSFWA